MKKKYYKPKLRQVDESKKDTHKICRTCDTEKELEFFHICRGKHQSKCKSCMSEYQRKFRRSRNIPTRACKETNIKICCICNNQKELIHFPKNRWGSYKISCIECNNDLIKQEDTHTSIRIEYKTCKITLNGKVYILDNISLEDELELRREGYSFIFNGMKNLNFG